MKCKLTKIISIKCHRTHGSSRTSISNNAKIVTLNRNLVSRDLNNMNFVFALPFFFAAAFAVCPEGFTDLPGLGCYYFDAENATTYQQALDFCEDLDGFLVSKLTLN